MSGAILNERSTLYDVIRAIEGTSLRTAVVLDPSRRLMGTLTDGDVRRCLLSGGSLQTLAVQAMNPNPVTAPLGSPSGYLLDLMKRANVMSIPLVDGDGRFVRLVHLTELGGEGSDAAPTFAAAVIMAGGEGTRLRPLTDGIPKPMVDIGGIPLLERLVRRLARAKVPQIFISVNYLSNVIEDHFGDGAALGADIRYLREQEKMGTAGALSLLREPPAGPLIVMNGDILTTSDFGCLYSYHQSHQAVVTVAAVHYHVDIPYGVIRANGAYAQALEEKPSQRFLCNAGMYAISREALDLIPQGFYNMTDLIKDCLREGRRVAVFPVHEYWRDIGTPADLEKAREAFASLRHD